MNLATTIKLYADGTSLVNVNEAEGPGVKDIARRRISKSNPDIDSEKENESRRERIRKKKKNKRVI